MAEDKVSAASDADEESAGTVPTCTQGIKQTVNKMHARVEGAASGVPHCSAAGAVNDGSCQMAFCLLLLLVCNLVRK